MNEVVLGPEVKRGGRNHQQRVHEDDTDHADARYDGEREQDVDRGQELGDVDVGRWDALASGTRRSFFADMDMRLLLLDQAGHRSEPGRVA